ncbi:tetratricopeptide repeat protein [Pseudoalteromonas luteoviolacea]|uniref:tetratricopeptide repeat protein n=1 Tax=Pseudoalteromonas luteoviolacea TaxID=43657 RepID=UPI00114F4630|nr:tetratricopeptide repeat protein [Pseudoalteromonas luteoviolacea]TQF67584.1 tetratricopeptide repeat protein [Pseudoalteromonas luteoviolacea]
MLAAIWLSVTVVLTPSEMFKTLNQLKDLNSKNSPQAADLFRSIESRLPRKPSRGLYELYRIGLESGVRVQDTDLVSSVVTVLASKPWQSITEGGELDIVTAVAIYHRRIHDYSHAEALNECAISYAANPKEFARVANNMAVVYRYSGQLAKASKILRESLLLAEDREIIANIKNNLGNIYFDQEKYRNAQLMYKRAFRFHSEVGQSGYAAGTGLNLLNTQIFLQDWQSFTRYKSSVEMEIEASNLSVFKSFFIWQQHLFEVTQKGKELKPEEIAQLIDAIPLLLKSELGPSLEFYAKLLNNQLLHQALQNQLEKTPNIRDIKAPTGKRVELTKWCSNSSVAKKYFSDF